MDRYRAGDVQAAQALADWLDAMYPTADEFVQNVVAVSFPALPPDPEAVATGLLGPNLTRTLHEMQNWRPGS
jgi:hypothetical protein